MQKTLFIKLSIIGSLCLLLAIGLSLIQSLVYERQQYSQTVIDEISNQHVNPQEVTTPFIAIPTTITPACKAAQPSDCPDPYSIITPKLAINTQASENLTVSTDTYQRGIYHATSYQGQLSFEQQYNLQANDALFANNQSANNQLTHNTSTTEAANDNTDVNAHDQLIPTLAASNNIYIDRSEHVNYNWQDARLIIPISDLRGVSQLPTVTVNGHSISTRYPSTPQMAGLSYVEALLPDNLSEQSDLQITIELPLMGISSLRTIPLGQQFSLSMDSNWHAPNFVGQALPAHKSFDNQGFKASWGNQYLTVANNQKITQCLINPNINCHIRPSLSADSSSLEPIYDAQVIADETTATDQTIRLNGFEVSFAEPNDVYLQTERTMKYALLLILVSFGTFFLFEVIKSLRIHPIQYLLVGSALLVFYVLLLPLAEQIVFWQAYAIAASACVGLIGWYAYYVLNSVKRAVMFTAILGGLYAGFYGILSTEDLNLLLGAIFCFVLLASVMYLTRRIDWYQVA